MASYLYSLNVTLCCNFIILPYIPQDVAAHIHVEIDDPVLVTARVRRSYLCSRLCHTMT
jgi:hypothetical protein